MNGIGESDQSVAVLIVAATVPDAPGTPLLLEAKKTSITIGWQVNYNGGISIDDFEVTGRLILTTCLRQSTPQTTKTNSL